MNTAVINVKVNPDLKAQAQDLAEELGFSLSSLINACLKQMIRTKTVSFNVAEEPTDYLLKTLEESKKDIKAGRVISFKNGKEALGYLDKLIADDKKPRRN